MKFFRAVGQVAGVIATVAAFIPGGQGIAAIAGAVSAVASTAAALTAKRPRAQGALTDRLIGANNPLPYLIGRGFSAGVQVHDTAWGGKVAKVQNPYSFTAAVYSSCGPIDGFESYVVDHNVVASGVGAVGGYYSGFLYITSQLGQRPEAGALTPHWAGASNWGAAHKLSGLAAVGWSAKFDKDGKVMASGLPPLGIVGRGVKAYDPRLDSTFPGGAGAQRLANEATWTWTRNAALHAGTYGFGRWVNGKLMFGIDMADAVDFGAVAAWANVCDANGWFCDGTIWEPVAEGRWNNLKKICAAGGGEPILTRGELTFSWHAPRVALDTIRAADTAPGPLGSTAMQGWLTQANTLRPKYRSEAHQWSDVQADAVSVPAFLAADGEPKEEEFALELVTDKDQAAELALYSLWNRREPGPFIVTVGPRLTQYAPGDTLTIDPDLELWPVAIAATIRKRTRDPATGFITLELVGETPAKHAACLGATGTAPPALTPPPPGSGDEAAQANAAIVAGTSVLTGQVGSFTALDFTLSAVLTFVLQPGTARTVSGQAELATPTGPGTARVQIEWRVAGGSWTAADGPNAFYDVTEPAMAEHSVTVSNGSSAALTYEVRGTVLRSNSNSGPLTAGSALLMI